MGKDEEITMQSKDFILKENSEEIRKKIQDAGIHVCGCAWFKDSCWLWYSTELLRSVHGVGYYGDEAGTKSQEEELKSFLSEVQNPIFCADVDEFIGKIKEFENR